MSLLAYGHKKVDDESNVVLYRQDPVDMGLQGDRPTLLKCSLYFGPRGAHQGQLGLPCPKIEL